MINTCHSLTFLFSISFLLRHWSNIHISLTEMSGSHLGFIHAVYGSSSERQAKVMHIRQILCETKWLRMFPQRMLEPTSTSNVPVRCQNITTSNVSFHDRYIWFNLVRRQEILPYLLRHSSRTEWWCNLSAECTEIPLAGTFLWPWKAGWKPITFLMWTGGFSCVFLLS